MLSRVGALAGYLWKNRSVQQSTDQLLSIAGFAAISLAMGSNDATTVDNVGKQSYRSLHLAACAAEACC